MRQIILDFRLDKRETVVPTKGLRAYLQEILLTLAIAKLFKITLDGSRPPTCITIPRFEVAGANSIETDVALGQSPDAPSYAVGTAILCEISNNG